MASDFLNYSPGLTRDILAEQKSRENFYTHFFKKIVSPNTLGYQKLIW